MHIRKTIQQEYAYNLKIDNTAHKLRGIEEQKDIGVIIDSNLENQKINKANSIMAVIRRSFTTLNQHNFVPLYKALVRSHLDYAIIIIIISRNTQMPSKTCRDMQQSSFLV